MQKKGRSITKGKTGLRCATSRGVAMMIVRRGAVRVRKGIFNKKKDLEMKAGMLLMRRMEKSKENGVDACASKHCMVAIGKVHPCENSLGVLARCKIR